MVGQSISHYKIVSELGRGALTRQVLICLFLVLFTATSGNAQYNSVQIPDTEVRTLVSSEVDGYVYELFVALPADYDETTSQYPVLYFLDASNQFAMLVQTYRLLRAFNSVEPLLLVGVAHTDNFLHDRARDFMPTQLSQEEVREKYGTAMAGFLPVSGGADDFLSFLRTEAIPFIEEGYRASPSRRGIFGHSAGGLFAAYALFNESELFSRYLIASSAVWWDDFEVLNDETRYASNNNSLPAKVLITAGSDEGELIIDAWRRLRDRLNSRSYDGLDFSAVLMDGESHVSVPPRTYSLALRYLYGIEE